MSTTALLLPAGTWHADPVHSSVDFRVRHLGVSTFRAGFAEIAATYDAATGTLTGAVPVASLDIGQADLRGHVLAPDFLDAATHPEVRFEAGDLHAGDGGAVTVPGRLTIRGVTRDVQATGRVGEPVEDLVGGERAELELRATIDRRDFGLDWQAELPGGRLALANEVTLEVTLELVREA
jgi:polyisoprenoid-binding protein YceI